MTCAESSLTRMLDGAICTESWMFRHLLGMEGYSFPSTYAALMSLATSLFINSSHCVCQLQFNALKAVASKLSRTSGKPESGSGCKSRPQYSRCLPRPGSCMAMRIWPCMCCVTGTSPKAAAHLAAGHYLTGAVLQAQLVLCQQRHSHLRLCVPQVGENRKSFWQRRPLRLWLQTIGGPASAEPSDAHRTGKQPGSASRRAKGFMAAGDASSPRQPAIQGARTQRSCLPASLQAVALASSLAASSSGTLAADNTS